MTPKIDSLIECFEELEVDVGIVTETWLRDGEALAHDLRELELRAGIAAVTLNRDLNQRTGVSHGRVGIFSRKSVCDFKKFIYPNPDKFEVLPAVTSLRGSARRLVVVAAYIPPNYAVPRARQCLEYIEGLLIQIRQKFRDPFVVIAGDFNPWEVEQALVEFTDIKEVLVGPTRGDRAIDCLFCNFSRGVTSSGTVPPLETEAEEAAKSNHKIAYVTAKIQTRQAPEWISYTYRQYSDEARDAFGRWLVGHDWMDVVTAVGSDEKAAAYQSQIDAALDRFFPLRTTRCRKSDLPWVNKALRKKIRRRKRLYKKYGRSVAWKRLRDKIAETLKERKAKYVHGAKEAATYREGYQ